MKCPGCGESNDAGMQFCILCGHSLAAASSSQASGAAAANTEELQGLAGSATAGAMVLVCSICNKTDPLNGQFCVYCGGRTVAGPARSTIQTQTFTANTTLPRGHSGSVSAQQLSEEFIRPIPAKAAPSESGVKSILGIFLAMLVGAALSLAATYHFRDEIQKTALHLLWPNKGVLLFSSPNNDLAIVDTKKKSLILGKTSMDGSLYIPTVSPGSYSLNLSDNKGKSLSKDFIVSSDEAKIIGYPNRLELK